MTQETPAKVLSLLGVALTSMFFLFAVSVTNAGFGKTEKAFPTAFNPDRVVALLDSAANSYSKFVDANLVKPAQESYAIGQYNLNYVIDEAGPSILAYTGLSGLVNVQEAQAAPEVAGASTQVVLNSSYQPSQGFGLYELLIR